MESMWQSYKGIVSCGVPLRTQEVMCKKWCALASVASEANKGGCCWPQGRRRRICWRAMLHVVDKIINNKLKENINCPPITIPNLTCPLHLHLLFTSRMNHFHSTHLWCLPYQFTHQFKCKWLILHSFHSTNSNHKPSIPCTPAILHIFATARKCVLWIRINKDKTFILLEQACLCNWIIFVP